MAKKENRMDGGGPRFSKRAKDVTFIKVGPGENGYGEWNFWSAIDGVSSNGWMCPVENGRPRRKKNNRWVWVRAKKLTEEAEKKEFEEKKKKILSASSRPAEPIPAGANHCNSCGGNGRSSLDERKKCEICRGKGYWTREDIKLYHKDCTEKSCHGSKHYGCNVKYEERSDREFSERMKKLDKKIEKLKAGLGKN